MQIEDVKKSDAETPLPHDNSGQSSTDPAEGSDDAPAPTKDSPKS